MRTTRPSTWKGFGIYVGALLGILIGLGILVDSVVLPMVVSATNTIVIPDVEGRTEQDAVIILQGRGLEVMPPHRQYSNEVKAGVVLNQMPYAGANVKEGRRVYLTVSKGVETATMPNLYGRTLREARLTMLRLGMQIGDVTYEPNDSIASETILYQSIPAGTAITSDRMPSVVLSQGPNGVPVPSVVGLKMLAAQALIEQSQLAVGAVRKQKSNTFESNVVLFQEPGADSLVPKGTTIMLMISE